LDNRSDHACGWRDLDIKSVTTSANLFHKRQLALSGPEDGGQVDRIIEMAWEDRTPFEAIKFQFGLAEKEVVALMRKELKRTSFNLWRKRVHQGVSKKHLAKRSEAISRFRCSLQRQITHNKISKR
jgi:uncharacterized protein (TIGR03643 family)